jgi:hypothetical protein
VALFRWTLYSINEAPRNEWRTSEVAFGSHHGGDHAGDLHDPRLRILRCHHLSRALIEGGAIVGVDSLRFIVLKASSV